MESPSVCARVLHAVWHRSIRPGADWEAPFSHRHWRTRPNFSSSLTCIVDFFFNSSGDEKKETMTDFVWERCSLKLFQAWPTEPSEGSEAGSFPGVPTEQLLLCLQSSEDMTQLSWDSYAWPFSESNLNISSGVERSPETSHLPFFFFLTETQTLESGSHFCFTLNNSWWHVTYGRKILHYLWCLDTNKDGKGDMTVSSTVH